MKRWHIYLYCLVLSLAFFMWVFPTFSFGDDGLWLSRGINFLLYLFDSPLYVLLQVSPLIFLWILPSVHEKLLSWSKWFLVLYLIPILVSVIMVWDDYYPHVSCAIQGHASDYNEGIGGIDKEENASRNDVQCLIRRSYTSNPEAHIVALKYAKSFQAMLTGEILYTQEELRDEAYFAEWNEPRVQQFTEFLECLFDYRYPQYDEEMKKLDDIDWIDYATVNTGMRSREYRMTLAGSSLGEISQKYCERSWMNTVQIPTE